MSDSASAMSDDLMRRAPSNAPSAYSQGPLGQAEAEHSAAKENASEPVTNIVDATLGYGAGGLLSKFAANQVAKQPMAHAVSSGLGSIASKFGLRGLTSLGTKLGGAALGMAGGPIGSLVGLIAPELVYGAYDWLSDPEQEKYLDELSDQDSQDAQNAAKWNAVNASTEGQSFIPPADQATGPFSPAASNNPLTGREYTRIVGEAQAAGFSDDEINVLLGENHYSTPAPAVPVQLPQEQLPSPLLMDTNATMPITP